MNRKSDFIAMACAVALAAAGLASLAHFNGRWQGLPEAEASAPTWSVILTVQNGNEYVVDHGLSLEDCRHAVAAGSDWPGGACAPDHGAAQ